MAKPRIFLSSTCYDLSKVRSELENFLSERGFEVINSEGKSFGVSPGLHSHTACLVEVEAADYLLLLIGTRHGSNYVGSDSSITNEEYRIAEKLEIPRIVAVERKVWEYRPTFSKNATADHSHVVNDVRVFSFIDYVNAGHSDNWIHSFDTIQDLKQILTTQFAHYLGLFSRSLRKNESKIAGRSQDIAGFPSNLSLVDTFFNDQNEATAMRGGLKGLFDLLRRIITDGTNSDTKAQKLKQLWIFARYADYEDIDKLRISMNRFKQHAWSYGKARRVNDQFAEYGVLCYLTEDESNEMIMKFTEADEEKPIAFALQNFAKLLLKSHDEHSAYEIFCRAEMRMFSA